MNGFKKIFWGFIFVFVDIRIGFSSTDAIGYRFDILPDIIGFIMIISGLAMIESLHHRFSEAKKFAYPLAFLSIFSIIEITYPAGEIGPLFGFFLVVGIIYIVLELLLIYNLCMGIAGASQTLTLESLAQKRWSLYLFSRILLILSSLLLVFFIWPLVLFAALLALVANIFILILLSVAERELSHLIKE